MKKESKSMMNKRSASKASRDQAFRDDEGMALDDLENRKQMVVRQVPGYSQKDTQFNKWSGDLEDDIQGGDHEEDAAEYFDKLTDESERNKFRPGRDTQPSGEISDLANSRPGGASHELYDKLIEKKEELERSIALLRQRISVELGPNEESQLDFNHPADSTEGHEDRERHLALVQQQDAELSQVIDAIHRTGTDTFGLCKSCGAPIGRDRLAALPYASLCINCQVEKDEEFSGGERSMPSSVGESSA